MLCRHWSEREDAYLLARARAGDSIHDIAEAIGRTPDATKRRWQRLVQRLRNPTPPPPPPLGQLPPRACVVCGHTLSRWNPDTSCWAHPTPQKELHIASHL